MNEIRHEHWPSRLTFIIASIGSVVGLGQIWRFPYLAYEHGGGAFVFAYIIATLLIGTPLLILETALGQMTQKSAPDAFAQIRQKYRIVGWFGVALVFIILAYYVVVMAWSIDYVAASASLLWGDNPLSFFNEKILHVSSGPEDLGSFSMPVLIGFILSWCAIYFSIWKGVKNTSKIVLWTATLPYLFITILLIRAITLPGASLGVFEFIVPKWETLLHVDVWLAALSQAFFSLSVATGVMITYGALNRVATEITKSVTYVSLAGILFSLLAGLSTFAVLGHMAFRENVAFSDVIESGPSVVFVTYPEVLSSMPLFPSLFSILFFTMILLLATDSAFSIVESIADAFHNRFPHVSLRKITLLVSLFGFLAGIPFITGAGIYLIDITDHFAVNYGIVAMGLIETIIIGWLWRKGRLSEFLSHHSSWHITKLWKFIVSYVAPIFLAILFILNLVEEFKEPYGGYPFSSLFYVGILPVLLSPFIGLLLDRFSRKSIPSLPIEKEVKA